MKVYILFIAVFVSMMQTVEAAKVQIDPLNSTVNIGESFTVDIVGIAFPETQGGGFNLTYDADILNITNVSIDEANTWTFYNDLGTVDNVNGELKEVRVSDFPGVTGDFTVATIGFLAIGLGTSRLNLTESAGNPWASNGSIISPALINDSSVQVVPLPGAVWLLGSGLLALISVSMRKADK
ncbi:MAG: cohesin domain-containing protein [Candidatus Thiodiazotropha sp. (ex Dulcina madagascariensis)]|nr:cohesin domain-containing protein [Candidatus Thiodiazotropha sp. (ex Dulcina madagascariensis)]MCU7925458.1 cohesin domain-containing protein [Candidatus Thiodiazotropha sp. (ex Dulcina madagascariensis)]